MKGTVRHHSISGITALVTAALFALCILCVLLAGAGVYRRVAAEGEESYAQRTCVQYVSTRVRQCGAGDCLTVEAFGDAEALVVREAPDPAGEEAAESRYCTRVYYYDGWLMELFSAEDGEFAPEDGERLLPAKGLEFSLENGRLTAVVTDEYGTASELVFSLRGGEEAVL